MVLSWDANSEDDLAGYKVRRATNSGGPFTLLASPTVTFYQDTTGTAGTYYYYAVAAIDLEGNESSPTTVQARKLSGDTTPPATPTGLTAEQTGVNSVLTDWDNNTESDLAGYWVAAATASGSFSSLTPSLIQISNYSHLLATSPNTWQYRVVAQDIAGNTSPPATVSIILVTPDTIPPATPSGLSISTTLDHIGLFWIAAIEPDLSHYGVESSPDDATWGTVSHPTQAFVLDTSAAIGSLTYYRISAFDTTGNQSGFLTGSATRPSNDALDLSSFVKTGTMVPCVVHARGVNKTRYRQLTSGTDYVSQETADFPALPTGTVLTAKYEWHFAAGTGESQGLYARLPGFNAAHAYDTPGQYTVRLVRTAENGASQRFETRVSLAADTRTAVYVSASGGATSGTGSPTAPVTLARAQQVLDSTDAVKVLLRNGDTFLTSGNFLILSRPNQMVSNFQPPSGSLLRPKVVLNTSNNGSLRKVFNVKKGAINFVIENLEIDQQFTGGDRGADYGVYLEGSGSQSTDIEYNGLVRNVRFTRIGRGVNPDEQWASSRYLLVQDCQWPLESSTKGGLQNYAVWVTGRDIVLLGLDVQDSQDEHPVRNDQPNDRVLVWGCVLKNLPPTTGDLNFLKQGIRIQQGRYIWVGECTLSSKQTNTTLSQAPGNHDFGPLGGADGVPYTNCQYVVLERCYIEGTLTVRHGLSDFICRNNVIVKAGNQCIEVQGKGSGTNSAGLAYTRQSARHYYYNNTLIHSGASECFFKTSTGLGDTMRVWNNLGVSTTLTGSQVNLSGGFWTNASFGRNTWGKGAGGTLNNFLVGGVSRPVSSWNALGAVGEDQLETVAYQTGTFRIPASSNAATYGSPQKGVFEDKEGTVRRTSDANWSCGALETNT